MRVSSQKAKVALMVAYGYISVGTKLFGKWFIAKFIQEYFDLNMNFQTICFIRFQICFQ